jgi:hypothetical protein
MKITAVSSDHINDPNLKNPAMKGRRWQIDYAFDPHSSYKKILKKPQAIEEIDADNYIDISYKEFYSEFMSGKSTSGDDDYTTDINIEEPLQKLNHIKEVSHSGTITSVLHNNTKSNGTSQTQTPPTPKLNIIPSNLKYSLDGTGEDEPRKGAYDFFKYRSDNSKYINRNNTIKQKKISLKEILKNIITKNKYE